MHGKMRLPCFWWGLALLCVVALFRGTSASASTSYPDCYLQHPEDYAYLGNGHCDMDYNNERCGFDGGDCCPCTCRQEQEYVCGGNGYDCMDPAASCFVDNGAILRELQTSSTESDTAMLSPSPAPTATPTSFWDASLEDVTTAASKLSTGALGAIVGACVVVALIAAAWYLYRKKQSAGSSGTTFSTNESASLT